MTNSRAEIIKGIVAERESHTGKGWDVRHDNNEYLNSLGQGAAAYAAAGACQDERSRAMGRALWPWEGDTYKPRDLHRNLIRAGALILAEIERLERLADTYTFYSLNEEIYAARSLTDFHNLLQWKGVAPDDLVGEIQEIDDPGEYQIKDEHGAWIDLRRLVMEAAGTVSPPYAIQLTFSE